MFLPWLRKVSLEQTVTQMLADHTSEIALIERGEINTLLLASRQNSSTVGINSHSQHLGISLGKSLNGFPFAHFPGAAGLTILHGEVIEIHQGIPILRQLFCHIHEALTSLGGQSVKGRPGKRLLNHLVGIVEEVKNHLAGLQHLLNHTLVVANPLAVHERSLSCNQNRTVAGKADCLFQCVCLPRHSDAVHQYHLLHFCPPHQNSIAAYCCDYYNEICYQFGWPFIRGF